MVDAHQKAPNTFWTVSKTLEMPQKPSKSKWQMQAKKRPNMLDTYKPAENRVVYAHEKNTEEILDTKTTIAMP